MPHHNHSSHARHTGGGSSSDEFGNTDEVKVFKDEGDGDEEKTSENLLEEKSSLIDLTENEEKSGSNTTRQNSNSVFNKTESHSVSGNGSGGGGGGGGGHTSNFNMKYLLSPYSHSNGSSGSLPVSMGNKMGLPPFFCHNGDHLTTPPPAHYGIPPYSLDPKAMSLTRPAIYPFPTIQYPYPMLSPSMSPVAASWHTPSVYSAATGFRSPYPSPPPMNTTLPSDFYRFSPTLLPSVHNRHVINSHPAIVTPGPKQEILPDLNNRSIRTSNEHKNSSHQNIPSSLPMNTSLTRDFYRFSPTLLPSVHNSHILNPHPSMIPQGPKPEVNIPDSTNNRYVKSSNSQKHSQSETKEINDKKKPHIKKPLNAFMLYMKEMRAKVVAECTLKESAAINQILGQRWHSLTREEQSKYYEKARAERQAHMELYPGWSARDNYGYGSKKKKRKKVRSPADPGGNSMKKCRARYGLDQQDQWCKPCRRKKKCIRYMESEEYDTHDSETTTSSAATEATSILSPSIVSVPTTSPASDATSILSPSVTSVTSPAADANSILSPAIVSVTT